MSKDMDTLMDILLDAYAVGYVQELGALPGNELMLYVKGYFEVALGINKSYLEEYMRDGAYRWSARVAEMAISTGLTSYWVERAYKSSVYCFPEMYRLSLTTRTYGFDEWKDLDEWACMRAEILCPSILVGVLTGVSPGTTAQGSL